MDEVDEIITEFVVESYEGLDGVEAVLLRIEETGEASPEALGNIFRTVHTIKGTCGFLGYGRLERLAHAGESLMAKLRDGGLTLTPAMSAALLEVVDNVRRLLQHIERTGEEPTGNGTDPLVERLHRLTDGEAAAPAPPPEHPPGDPAEAPTPAENASEARGERDAPPHPEASAADQSIRVTVDLLDKLMNLVGELVLVRNQILQHPLEAEDGTLLAAIQRLNLVTTELQQGVMQTRMQPIRHVWSKFPRVVRDLSRAFDKEVRLEMEGRETELDRTLIEAIRDPLTHLIRNSVDHGIEGPAERAAAGKPREGVIHLSAYHEGGRVHIEIRDDGRGLQCEKILAKAIERGLVAPEEAVRLSPREAANLVFLPGFSTAERVTNVSGRGVGMDVVRNNLERIGGTIEVLTEPGRGTTFGLKIPLTLAIVPALLVEAVGKRFAIPQVNLIELVRLEGEEELGRIESIHGAPMYRLRGNLLPLVFLAEQLGAPPPAEAPEELLVVVVQADGTRFGLVVDAAQDTKEIVVKPLGEVLDDLDVYAGATIMGDGRVTLILDVVGLAQRAGVLRPDGRRGAAEAAHAEDRAVDQQEALLLFECGPEGLVGLPLATLDRLEELPRGLVERSGALDVVQYRGAILPLVDLSERLFGQPSCSDADPMQVIVYSQGDRRVGFVVDRLVDIVETELRLERVGRRRGVLGSAVVEGRVAQILDAPALVQDAVPGLLSLPPPGS
jgi:two-component system chemotaxis sensor kinase CheA